MMKNNEKKKGNNAKKILPAAGMLALSASMLATSTYAWFTMSREVELKNIQMTASVPEDLQISLGMLTDIKGASSGNPNASEIAAGRSTLLGLQGNQGILSGSADNGGATAPYNNSSQAIEPLLWANTVDISEYYRFGKIIPASSVDGENIFFTPDASQVGKTLKDGAKFYKVAELESATFAPGKIYGWDTSTKTYVAGGSGDKARTTLHAINNVDANSDKWNLSGVENDTGNSYNGADAWNLTNDDGYYVDIPVWLRSSSKDDVTLSVDAFVTTNAAKRNDGSELADDELYLAARAAIIYATDVSDATKAVTVNDSSNLLRIRKDSFASTKSVTDYMFSTNNTGDAVSSVTDYVPTYGAAVEYDGTAILKVPGRNEDTTDKYGNMVKAVVRVWLEGEDPNCWNQNAGQDFNISLRFVNGAIGSTTDETANANEVLYPSTWGAPNHADADVTDSNMTVTITAPKNSGSGTLKFTHNGLTGSAAKWNLTEGSFEILDGWTYKINGTPITSTDDIARYLLTTVTNKELAAATYTIVGTDTNAPAGD